MPSRFTYWTLFIVLGFVPFYFINRFEPAINLYSYGVGLTGVGIASIISGFSPGSLRYGTSSSTGTTARRSGFGIMLIGLILVGATYLFSLYVKARSATDQAAALTVATTPLATATAASASTPELLTSALNYNETKVNLGTSVGGYARLAQIEKLSTTTSFTSALSVPSNAFDSTYFVTLAIYAPSSLQNPISGYNLASTALSYNAASKGMLHAQNGIPLDLTLQPGTYSFVMAQPLSANYTTNGSVSFNLTTAIAGTILLGSYNTDLPAYETYPDEASEWQVIPGKMINLTLM